MSLELDSFSDSVESEAHNIVGESCVHFIRVPLEESLSKAQALVASNARDTILRFPEDPTCDICMRAESNDMLARGLAPEKRVESQATKLGERIHVGTIRLTREGVGGC